VNRRRWPKIITGPPNHGIKENHKPWLVADWSHRMNKICRSGIWAQQGSKQLYEVEYYYYYY
jgi:hypothetical protein